jgi:hypothetical protein
MRAPVTVRVLAWIAALGFLWSGRAISASENTPAATSTPPPPRSAKACATPEFRQFDFWLGNWAVTDPKGNVAGKNLITLEQGGCVLHEHWTGSKGGTGESFNLYDGATLRWHQTWVDNGGTLLLLDGGLVDGRMVLTGKGLGLKGESVTNRIVWEKLADGRVRQTWTVSADGGATWTTSFDGYYAKH